MAKTSQIPAKWNTSSNRIAQFAVDDRVGPGYARPQAFDYRTMEFVVDAGAFTWQNRGWFKSPIFDGGDLAIGSPTGRPRARAATAATTGAAAGIRPFSYVGIGEFVRREWHPILIHALTPGNNIPAIRLWVGFAAASLDAVGTVTTQTCAAFRYSTDVDGTAFWRTVTSNGATATTTTTTQSIAISTEYEMRIEMDSSEVVFFVNDVAVATHTTNLPPLGTNLSPLSRMVTLENVLKRTAYGDLRVLHR